MCERELKIKTEEVEKLKTELRDLKQIISLTKDVESLDTDGRASGDIVEEDADIRRDKNITEEGQPKEESNPWIKPINKSIKRRLMI